MNRILACTASDFGKATTPLEIKDAIKASEVVLFWSIWQQKMRPYTQK